MTAETLLPSILTTDTSVAAPAQRPFGTYETTFVPVTRTDNELAGAHEPCSTTTCSTLKLSVLAFGLVKLMTFGSEPEIDVLPVWAINQTLYSPPAFGVAENGAIRTGVEPFAGLKVPIGCGQGPVDPVTLPPATVS